MILLQESSHIVAVNIVAPGEPERNPGFRNAGRPPSACRCRRGLACRIGRKGADDKGDKGMTRTDEECSSLGLAAEQRPVCSKGCIVLRRPRADADENWDAGIGRKGTEDDGDDGITALPIQPITTSNLRQSFF